MSEFEKELEKNMKLNKVAYERENIYSDFLISKRDIERIFHDWQPPKPLVKIPQIVADSIKAQKIRGIKPLMDSAKIGEIDFTEEKLHEILYWINEHQEEYMRAWLDGYTVEKEKKYEVEFYVDEEDDRCLLMKTGKTISFEYESQNEGHYQQQFTEAEIKAIDKRYWAFRKEVVEP